MQPTSWKINFSPCFFALILCWRDCWWWCYRPQMPPIKWMACLKSLLLFSVIGTSSKGNKQSDGHFVSPNWLLMGKFSPSIFFFFLNYSQMGSLYKSYFYYCYCCFCSFLLVDQPQSTAICPNKNKNPHWFTALGG